MREEIAARRNLAISPSGLGDRAQPGEIPQTEVMRKLILTGQASVLNCTKPVCQATAVSGLSAGRGDFKTWQLRAVGQAAVPGEHTFQYPFEHGQ